MQNLGDLSQSDLSVYRSIHHARYLERVRQKSEKEEREKQKQLLSEREAVAKLEHASLVFVQANVLIDAIRRHTTISEIHESVHTISGLITENQELLEKQTLSQVGLELLDALNTNVHTKTNFNNASQVSMSRDVQQTVKHVLTICGVIVNDDDIEVNYDMDCSRDEEVARQLAQDLANAPFNPLLQPIPPLPEVPHHQPPQPRRPRGRPRRT
jgi:hypothetical protein